MQNLEFRIIIFRVYIITQKQSSLSLGQAALLLTNKKVKTNFEF